jgi:hypothetical protein
MEPNKTKITTKENILMKVYDFAKKLFPATGKFPKNHRYTLGSRIEEKTLEIIELLTKAYYSKDKAEHLDSANINIELLRFLLRLSSDFRFISLNYYAMIIGDLDEIGKMTGGWRKIVNK